MGVTVSYICMYVCTYRYIDAHVCVCALSMALARRANVGAGRCCLVCMNVCMYRYIVRMCALREEQIWELAGVASYVCVYVFMYRCIDVYIYECAFSIVFTRRANTSMYVFMYVCMYV